MTEIWPQLVLFLAESLIVLLVAGVLLALLFGGLRSLASEIRSRRGDPEALEVTRLNDQYAEAAHVLQSNVLNRRAFKRIAKQARKKRKLERKGKLPGAPTRRIFVLDFHGDLRASQVSSLREEISAVLSQATKEDEVVLRLENAGGTVHDHGLAASELLRFKSRGIPLTVIVDKIAASGGYMMACTADRLVAAPFAIVGSIGVLAQIPNFNKALTERGVEFEQITAGQYKRTITLFGKNTDEGRAKLKQELEDVHTLFKTLVSQQRPQLDIEKVATGEHWYGQQALELGLIDEIGSSDDYLIGQMESADLYQVRYRTRPTLEQRARRTVRAVLDELGSLSH